MRALIIGWATIVLASAFWTGWARGHWWHMTGFFEPHRGYAMYAASVLPLLAPRWLGGRAWAGMLLSRTRAAQIGVLAAWAASCWARRNRDEHFAPKLLLLFGLAFAAVLGGAAMKPYGAKGDSDRVMIWKTAVSYIAERPWMGWGSDQFYVGVGGLAISKAHSDVLQLALERGVPAAALALFLLAWGLCRLPETPEKAVVVALTTQSLIDNRLHHPACAALYAAAWLAAALARPRP